MHGIRYASQGINSLSEEQLRAHQWMLLQQQISYCLDNSTYYRKRFKDLDVEVGDIKGLDDFLALPVLMGKDQERLAQNESLEKQGHPFSSYLCARLDQIAVTATTSGTTGDPTFTYTLTHSDLRHLNSGISSMMNHAGILPGERVLFAHALGIYATSAVLPPLRNSGVLPIDVDVRGGTDAILKFAQMTSPTALMTTPSLAQYLAEAMPQKTGKPVSSLNLKAVFVVGEIGAGIPEIKEKIESAYGCRVYDWIAPFAQTLAFSCNSHEYHGMHAVTPEIDLYPLDLIDPETGRHVEPVDGAIGEAICTSLNRQARPILKYATGDIVQIYRNECPNCGFKGPRFKVIGRSDDMLIVKGANIYPASIRTVINEFVPQITGQMRIVLNQPPPRVEPPLLIKVEKGEGMTDEAVKDVDAKIKNALHTRIRLTPAIEWVNAGELERAVTKTPMFEKRY
ncbi:phenylacetate--CoA ligase [Ottowia sp. GY511]|uniref:Phenylacetate--CoA ligase family protein n=1 Tax=Ottowia flava TaxID=2675430 RepID=A0ABW4KSN7_9BURK|nr:AMP-binding protein [Ottowia sp. GY511]TXK33009.1 phenylacetate--CoA ligase [Ottowia sp. GY511]